MKPIYKSLALAAMTLQVSVSLQAQVTDGENINETPIPAEVLDSLRVELVAPNVSGARDLIKSGECTVSDNALSITLNAGDWLKGGVYRLQVSATFGTQTQVIYALDITVPRYGSLASEPQEYEDTVTVVSTYGDGDKSGADATVYAKDGDGNAHVTTPLSIGNGVATGGGSIASGNVVGEGASIQSTGEGSIASGYAGDGASIQATGSGAIASGNVEEEGASIQATGSGTIASGYVGDGASIQSTGDGAIASGNANATYGNVEASGQASQAFGIGVKATQDGQMAVGKCNVVDDDDTFAFIVGNGTDDENRSNAFAVTKSGGLALFEADGTPVILDAAKLKALIASLS